MEIIRRCIFCGLLIDKENHKITNINLEQMAHKQCPLDEYDYT